VEEEEMMRATRFNDDADSVAARAREMALRSQVDIAATHITELNGVSVLLVEDSWHIAEALKSLLENAGLDVWGPAPTAAAALEAISAGVPPLAIVDINLRGEPAYDLIDRLIGDGVAVVVISGYERVPKVEGKAKAVLTKPIRASALLQTLRRVVGELRQGVRS